MGVGVCTDWLVDFKELAPTVVGAGKSEIHRASWQSGNSGRS